MGNNNTASDIFASALFVTLLAMSIDQIDKEADGWIRLNDRQDRARALRQYARNCQACALGGTSHGPKGTSRVGPRDARNQLAMAEKAARLARAANRVDSSVVSYRAVSDLEALVRDLRVRNAFRTQPSTGVRSVDIS
jgi:hypothetical protein